jgi:hypothetical protein
VSQFTQRLGRRTWCGAVAAIGLGAWDAGAALPALNIGVLTQRALGAYVVRPAESTSAWESVFGAARIVTTFSVVVERTLVGHNMRQVVEVRELGGQVGDLVQRVGHTAVLRLGQPSLVFLTAATQFKAGGYWVLGMEQGCYPLISIEGDYEVSLHPEQRWLLGLPGSVAGALVGRRLRAVEAELARLRSA